MTVEEALSIVRKVKIRGCEIRFYPGDYYGTFQDRLIFRFSVRDRDAEGRDLVIGHVMPFEPERYRDEKELLDEMRQAVHTFYRHEADELFIYDGKRPFDPHEEKAA